MRFCFFLLLVSSLSINLPASAQAAQPSAAQPKASPSQAYMQLSADCCKLLRKAGALPDAQGVALLRQQVPPLQARAKPVTRAFAQWLKSLTPAQQEAESNRLIQSDFAKELEKTMASLGPNTKHSRAFIQLVANLMESMAEGL